MIKERPILFNSAMVKAIMDGRKTQTRRVINPQPELTEGSGFKWKGMLYGQNSDFAGTCRNFSKNACKLGKIGDRLWVRETWRYANWAPFSRNVAYVGIEYKADKTHIKHMVGDFNYDKHINFRPSIHMPRWASRILLEITNVRVERLNDISEEDAEAEGIDFLRHYPDSDESLTAKQLYLCLWDSINGKGSWDINPYVWVLEFKVIK